MNTRTAPTIDTPVETGKVTRNTVSVDDDLCTGEQGKWWYDTTYSRFEFCDANSGVPTVLGGGGGSANSFQGEMLYSMRGLTA